MSKCFCFIYYVQETSSCCLEQQQQLQCLIPTNKHVREIVSDHIKATALKLAGRASSSPRQCSAATGISKSWTDGKLCPFICPPQTASSEKRRHQRPENGCQHTSAAWRERRVMKGGCWVVLLQRRARSWYWFYQQISKQPDPGHTICYLQKSSMSGLMMTLKWHLDFPTIIWSFVWIAIPP